jgi:hypothetical protein
MVGESITRNGQYCAQDYGRGMTSARYSAVRRQQEEQLRQRFRPIRLILPDVTLYCVDPGEWFLPW